MADDHNHDDDRPWRAEEVLAKLKNWGNAADDAAPSTGQMIRETLEAQPGPVMPLGLTSPTTLSHEATASTAAREHVAPTLPTRPPLEVPNHELLRCLGLGGFGQVWLARHTMTEHYRACKLIDASKAVELEGLRQLKQRVPGHTHLFPIEEVGTAGDWIFVLMPLADHAGSDVPTPDIRGYEALTLHLQLKRRGRLPTREAAQIGAELADALCHLHEHGVTHGDVKPGNVLRLASRWTLADYGLARDLAKPHGAGHTPGYVPPEGPGGTAADQYALGVVLFEMLTGGTAATLDEFRSSPIKRYKLDAEAPRLRDVILRATSPQLQDRFGSLREMTAALRAICTGGPRRRWPIAAALVAVLAIAAALVVPPLVKTPPRSAVRVESFEVRHYRFDGTNDVALGRIGQESDAARFDDDIAVHATLTRPAYAYLVALDTSGKVTPCLPASASTAPRASDNLAFPADPGSFYRLNDGAGTQGFMLMVSADPLPSWAEWKAAHGDPAWTPGDPPAEGVWLYNGTELALAPGTRGEVVQRRGGPRPVLDVVEWVKQQRQVQSAYLVAFPVKPQEP